MNFTTKLSYLALPIGLVLAASSCGSGDSDFPPATTRPQLIRRPMTLGLPIRARPILEWTIR